MGGFAIAACNDTLYHYLGKLIPRRKIRYDVPPLLPRAAVRHDGCRHVLRLPDPLPRAAVAIDARTRAQRLAVVASGVSCGDSDARGARGAGRLDSTDETTSELQQLLRY